MGNAGKATSFFCESDWHIAPGLADLLKESNQEVPQFLAKMKYNNSILPQKKSWVMRGFYGQRFHENLYYWF